MGSAPLREPTRIANLLKRPNLALGDLLPVLSSEPLAEVDVFDRNEILTGAEMELRYGGYLDRERERALALRRHADFRLPPELPYSELFSLSTEARQKLGRIRPLTLGQAGRIPGISPSDLQNLVMEVRKRAGDVGALASTARSST
jgi:tRNA uridine 5-carboxymethylaminomethyl modification enzyme